MPDHKHQDAFKRMRQNEKRRVRNRAYRSRMRTEIKKLRVAIEAGAEALSLLHTGFERDRLLAPFEALIDGQISAMGEQRYQRNYRDRQ